MHEIFKLENVFYDLEVSSKEDCLEKLAQYAFESGISNDAQQTYQDYLNREKEVSTGFTDGFAIPHAKSSSIEKPAILVAKLKNSVDWKSMDGEPTQIIIVLNIPKESKGGLHIQLLSNLSRKIMKADFREAVQNSQSAAELFKAVNHVFN